LSTFGFALDGAYDAVRIVARAYQGSAQRPLGLQFFMTRR
jgi:hypothetical protein